MTVTLYIVDAFTNEAFQGNPAAVCVLPEERDDSWLQNIAAEMNLSETAFLYPLQSGYSLRWFTPTTEVELCGHATLASAHILWEYGFLKFEEQATFHTKSGLLTAIKSGSWIEMNFPSEAPLKVDDYPSNLIQALSIDPLYVGRNRFDYIIEIESEDILKTLTPNYSLLGEIPARGVIVTSRSTSYDFISRCFFPAVGVNEDPVTGSAHCCLVPYWKEKLNQSNFTAYQASLRGGVLRLRSENDRVILAGQAITVLKSELLIR
ncbi:MAG TPA: PhzF family phenazine biosynthesis protein [Bacilli bacterium]